MDIRTIIVLTIFVNVFIFIFFFWFIKISKFKNNVLNTYVVAKFINALAWFFLVLRYIHPNILLIAIANSTIIVAFGLEILAITTRPSDNINKRLKIFFKILIVLVLGFIAIIKFEENVRIAYISLVLFVWYIIGALQFLRKKDRDKFKITVGIVYILFSTLAIIRSYVSFFINKEAALNDNGVLQTIVFSSIFLSNFIGVVVLLLLLKEEDEKTININNERYKKFIEYLPQIVFEVDVNGKIIYVNKQAFSIMGFSKEDMDKGLNMSDVLVKEDLSRALGNVKSIMSGNVMSGEEYRMRKKNGEEIPVLIYSLPIYENNKVLGLRGIVVDISLRKIAEKNLIDSERNYKLLFDNSPLGIYTADKDGNILDANKQLLTLIGSPSLEETKKINILKFSPLIENGYTSEFIEICRTGKMKKFSTFYKTKWGKSIYLSNTIVPLKDASGKINKIYTVMEDVSEQKKTERELQERDEYLTEINKQLNELVVTKDKFFSIIAHDLKGPIGTVVGFSRLLVDNFEKYTEQEQKQYINILYNSVNKTYRLLENLLLWSKSQQNTLQFNPERDNLFLLSNESIEILTHMAKGKEIRIDNNIPKDLTVNVDRDMILTVFRNLLSNAIKFTHKGGVIELTASSNNIDFIEVCVKDNGVGISKDKQLKLFDISENTITKGTEDEQGTGLGLILCKEFIEKHNGKIWVESNGDKGSSFIFTLKIT